MQNTAKKAALPATALAALGVVFGDIGTSPLYALKESFHAAHGLGIRPENVFRHLVHYFLVFDADY